MTPVRQLLLVVLFAVVAACGSDTQEFTVEGDVVGVLDNGRALIIDHEEIPDFMGAMEMQFEVSDPSQASALAIGDRIRFILVVTDRDMIIDSIEKL